MPARPFTFAPTLDDNVHMSVTNRHIAGFDVRVQRRKGQRVIRLHVRGDGSVTVTAPHYARNADIDALVETHVDWIARQQEKLADSPGARAERASDAEKREWRAVVEAGTRVLLEKWEPVMGVRHKTLAFRSMKSRWGSCQPSTGRICINTRLALFPPRCLEYVVVHELCHLLVPNHGPDFKALMDRYLPDWRETKKLLRM